MSLKKLVTIGICAALASTVIGCGSSANDKEGLSAAETNDTSAQSVETESANSPNISEYNGKEGAVELRFMTWNPDDAALSFVNDDWTKSHADISFTLEHYDYSNYIQNLKIQLAAGQGPDVMGIQDGTLIDQFKDFLLPLDDYAKQKWGDNWQDGFNPLYMQLIKANYDVYYALPLGGTSAGYLYANKNFLDKYSLSVPQNYSDLKADCEVLNKNGEYPLLADVSQGWIAKDLFMAIATDVNAQKLYDAIDGKCDWTDADLVKAFQIYKNLFSDKILPEGVMGGITAQDIFTTDQNGGLFFMGSWYCNEIASNETMNQQIKDGNDYPIFTIDWNDDGKTSPVTTGPDVCLCVNKNSEHIDEAVELVEFLVTDGAKDMIDGKMQYLPARTDYQLPADKFTKTATNDFEYAIKRINDGTEGYREIPYPDLSQALVDELANIGMGTHTAEEAAQAMQDVSTTVER